MKKKVNEHDRYQEIYGHFDDIVEYVMCLGMNMDDAEDVAQETLKKACMKHLQLRDPNKLRAWIMKIAYRNAMHQLKKLSKQWKHEASYVKDIETGEEIDIYEVIPAEKSAEECLCDFEREERLLDVLRELSDKEWHVFVKHNVEGYKLKEIAEMLDINESTVRSIHSRVRKKLAGKLEKLIGEED